MSSVDEKKARSLNVSTKKKKSFYDYLKWDQTTIVRISTGVCLIVLCAGFSYATYYITTELNHQVYETQYNSIASTAYDSIVQSAVEKIYGSRVMSTVLSQQFPSNMSWPNTTWRGYESTAKAANDFLSFTGMGFAPIVQPDERGSFQDHVYNFYSEYPEQLGDASIEDVFDVGISKVNPATGERISDLTGATGWGSPNVLFTPLMHTYPNKDILLLNLHAEPNRGAAIDSIIDCAHNSETISNCGAATDFIELVTDNAEDVSYLIIEPIYPADDPNYLAGIIVQAYEWNERLIGVVPDFVSGLDMVLTSSSGQSFTFTFDNGKPKLKGRGDKHDTSYNGFKKGGSLLGKYDYLQNSNSVSYTVYFYPSDEFVDVYNSEIPTYSTITVVAIMIITVIVFIIHDFALQRENKQKQVIIDTKRKFVRFISHEIRTPLNTVSLGLKLVESELKQLLTDTAAFFASNISDVKVAVEKSFLPRPIIESCDEEKPHRFNDTADTKCEETGNAAIASLLQEKIEGLLSLTDDLTVNTESAVNVLSDLLNYDKIESGTMELDCLPTNFWILIEKATKAFEIQAKQKNVTINLILERDSDELESGQCEKLSKLRVMGDELRLVQVLRNLISNALKFTPSEGKITLSCCWQNKGLEHHINTNKNSDDPEFNYPRAGSLVLKVVDTGAGLSEAQLQRIFGEGVQFNVAELQSGQGSGLGLCIAKGLVEQHGGSLQVSSEGINKGCTFTLELPVYQFDIEDAKDSEYKQTLNDSLKITSGGGVFGASHVATEDDNNDNFHQSKRKLLIVDDAPLNRKMLVRLMKAKGHECIEAEDGLDAIAKFEAFPPNDSCDCILMDNQMPNCTGPEAARKIRELGFNGLIVGISGNVLPEDVHDFIEAGANAVLPKPLNLTELEEVWSDFHNNKPNWV